jgi:hypothetical protein
MKLSLFESCYLTETIPELLKKLYSESIFEFMCLILSSFLLICWHWPFMGLLSGMLCSKYGVLDAELMSEWGKKLTEKSRLFSLCFSSS